jgi:hypothetical protein
MKFKENDNYIVDDCPVFNWFAIYNKNLELVTRICYGGIRKKEEAKKLVDIFIKTPCKK